MLSRASRLTGRNVVYLVYGLRRENANESRRDRWKAPGSEVSTFLFENKKKPKKKEKSLPYAFNIIQPLVLVHTGLTRTRMFYELYLREKLYTRKIVHTEQKEKKKRNTIILYSRSAFCLQFHFNLLFVNLPSTLRKALHTCAQKKIQKRGEKKKNNVDTTFVDM